MSCGRKEWDSSQLRKYDFHLEPIHRLHYKDPKVEELMKLNVRISLTVFYNCSIFFPTTL